MTELVGGAFSSHATSNHDEMQTSEEMENRDGTKMYPERNAEETTLIQDDEAQAIGKKSIGDGGGGDGGGGVSSINTSKKNQATKPPLGCNLNVSVESPRATNGSCQTYIPASSQPVEIRPVKQEIEKLSPDTEIQVQNGIVENDEWSEDEYEIFFDSIINNHATSSKTSAWDQVKTSVETRSESAVLSALNDFFYKNGKQKEFKSYCHRNHLDFDFQLQLLGVFLKEDTKRRRNGVEKYAPPERPGFTRQRPIAHPSARKEGNRLNSRYWTDEEDDLFFSFIQKFKVKKTKDALWEKVAEQIKTRTQSQVFRRLNIFLNGGIQQTYHRYCERNGLPILKSPPKATSKSSKSASCDRKKDRRRPTTRSTRSTRSVLPPEISPGKALEGVSEKTTHAEKSSNKTEEVSGSNSNKRRRITSTHARVAPLKNESTQPEDNPATSVADPVPDAALSERSKVDCEEKRLVTKAKKIEDLVMWRVDIVQKLKKSGLDVPSIQTHPNGDGDNTGDEIFHAAMDQLNRKHYELLKLYCSSDEEE